MRKTIAILIMLLNIKAFPQWHALPGLSRSTLLIAGDGHILYTDGWMLGNDTYAYLWESHDDLHSTPRKLSEYCPHGWGYALINILASRDSTTFLYYETMGSGLWSTTDDFTNSNNISTCYSIPFFPPASLTKSYIYSNWQSSATDSFHLTRNTYTSPYASFCKILSKYNGQSSALHFVNDSIGFLFCCYRNNIAKKTLLKTVDFGITWNELYTDSLLDRKSFSFPSENVGYILKSDNSLIKTIDGGNTWATVNTPLANYKSLAFSNDSIGYMGGSSGYLIRTSDGGNTWAAQNSNTTKAIISLYAFPNDVAYLIDSVAHIYKNKPLLPSLTPTVNVTASTTLTCAGTPVILTAIGATTYTWSSNAGGTRAATVTVSPLVTTNYTVTGATGAYANSNTISIGVIPNPSVSVSPSMVDTCKGASISFRASGADNYTWNISPNDTNEITIITTENDSFYVTGFIQNCADTQTFSIRVRECFILGPLKTYPNPANQFLYIENLGDPNKKHIGITDVLGREQNFTWEFIEPDLIKIDLINLSVGVYILRMETPEVSNVKKFVIQRK